FDGMLATPDLKFFSVGGNLDHAELMIGVDFGPGGQLVVKSDLEPDERRAAYGADITYCTNKDVVFDYLRDRMALGQQRSRSRLLVQRLLGRETAWLLSRGLHFAIVDEADSILIDEARTPLILSANGPSDDGNARYRRALDIAASLVPGRDYSVSKLTRQVELTPEGQLHAR